MPRSYIPPRPLKTALSVPKTIMEKSSGTPIFRVTLAKELGLSPEANLFRELLTASSGFGLTSGSRTAEKIELEQRGRDAAKGSPQAIYDALFSVEVFQRFHEYFTSGAKASVPSEQSINDFLRSEFGVPDRQCGRVAARILEDARDWCLIQEVSGREMLVPRELAMETAAGLLKLEPPKPVPTPPVVPDTVEPSVKVSRQLQLNIEIHIAADTPEEKIETIFRNMKKYLLNHD